MVGEEYGKVRSWGDHPSSMVGLVITLSTNCSNKSFVSRVIQQPSRRVAMQSSPKLNWSPSLSNTLLITTSKCASRQSWSASSMSSEVTRIPGSFAWSTISSPNLHLRSVPGTYLAQTGPAATLPLHSTSNSIASQVEAKLATSYCAPTWDICFPKHATLDSIGS